MALLERPKQKKKSDLERLASETFDEYPEIEFEHITPPPLFSEPLFAMTGDRDAEQLRDALSTQAKSLKYVGLLALDSLLRQIVNDHEVGHSRERTVSGSLRKSFRRMSDSSLHDKETVTAAVLGAGRGDILGSIAANAHKIAPSGGVDMRRAESPPANPTLYEVQERLDANAPLERGDDYNLACALAALLNYIYTIIELLEKHQAADPDAITVQPEATPLQTFNVYTALCQELSSLQSQRPMMSASPLQECVALWNEIDRLMIIVTRLAQDRPASDILPTYSDLSSHLNDNEKHNLPDYARDPEKTHRDLENVLLAIERVISVAPRLNNQCVELTEEQAKLLATHVVCKAVNGLSLDRRSSTDSIMKYATINILVEQITKSAKRSLNNQRVELSQQQVQRFEIAKLNGILERIEKGRFKHQDWLSPEQRLLEDMTELTNTLNSIEDPKMVAQRFILSDNKEMNMQINAVMQKVDRSSTRRLDNQDAEYVKPSARKKRDMDDLDKMLAQFERMHSPLDTQRAEVKPKLKSHRRYAAGIAALLSVVLIWVGSSFLMSSLFADRAYNKPFFVTYLNTASFSLYLIPTCLARRKKAPEHAPLDSEQVRLLTPPQDEFETSSSHPSPPPLNATAMPHPDTANKLSARETAKLSLTFCMLWFLANWSTNSSLAYTTVGSSTILSSMSGLFTLAIGSWFKIETFNMVKLAAVLITLLGVILVSHDGPAIPSDPIPSIPTPASSTLLGDMLALIGAFFYGCYTVLLKLRIKDESRVDMPLFFGFVGAFNVVLLWPVFGLLHVLGIEQFALPSTGTIWGMVIINALIGTFLSDYMWLLAVLMTSPLVVTLGLSLTIVDPEIPQIERGLEQIENQSRKLVSLSHRQEQEGADTRAHYFLASGGVNAHQLSKNLNTINFSTTFEPAQPTYDTDIEGFLRQQQDLIIMNTVEESRRRTLEAFEKSFEQYLYNDWDQMRKDIFAELGESGAAGESSGFSEPVTGVGMKDITHTQSSAVRARVSAYAEVIRNLNDNRLTHTEIGIVNACKSVLDQLGDSRSTPLAESFQMLASVIHERRTVNGELRGEALNEAEYAQAYLDSHHDSLERRRLRMTFVKGAIQYMEDSFMAYVDKAIASNPHEANLGGVPSIHNKITAYLNVKFKRLGAWNKPNLEIVNNVPIWAHLFYLIRGGHGKAALAFARENEAQLAKLEQGFLLYLQAYMDSDDHSLLADYNQRLRYLSDSSDPFKLALYKIIGRCEIRKKASPDVIPSWQDYLWLQLTLVRETEYEQNPQDRYTLHDLQASILKAGPQHYDRKGDDPFAYLQNLILTAQFERAVAYLYTIEQYQLDAVHLAICLAYYGLIHLPSSPNSSDSGLFSVGQENQGNEISQLDFTSLIYEYTRQFPAVEAEKALHYLYLLCLFDGHQGMIGREQVKLCHRYIRDLILESREFVTLLGEDRPEGRVPGVIEKYLDLIKIANTREFLNQITKQAAEKSNVDGRFKDAVAMYNLAEDYNSVVAVINKHLGDALLRPNMKWSSTASEGSAEDVKNQAEMIMKYYEKDAYKWSQITDQNRETCVQLCLLLQAMKKYAEGEYSSALEGIRSTNLIPLDGDMSLMVRKAEEYRLHEEAIARTFPEILVTTMTILHKKFTELKKGPYGDLSRQNNLAHIRRQARNVMIFAGMIRYRMPADTYARLNRATSKIYVVYVDAVINHVDGYTRANLRAKDVVASCSQTAIGYAKSIFFVLAAVNLALVGFDYYKGGPLVTTLVSNVQSISPEKIAGSVTNAFTQLQQVKQPADVLDILKGFGNDIGLKFSGSSSPVLDGNVWALDTSSFDKVIDGSKPALVEFYAPWCGHCKNLAPVYAELGDAYQYAQDQVVIAKVDADAHRDLGQRFGVQGFPTLKWFPKGVTSPDQVEAYSGGRDLESLSAFIRDKTGLRARVKPVRSDVRVLVDSTFGDIVMDKEKNVLVEFYAPWCGHCKNLAPTYEKVGFAFANEGDCIVAKIDGDSQTETAGRYEVAGFPTIKFFPKGEDKTPIDYEGGRSEADFIKFLNEKCGTHRVVGGGLDAEAGKIAELDTIAEKFVKAKEADRQTLQAEAKQIASVNKSRYADYYAKVMEKVLENGDAFLRKEKGRLDKISSKGTVTPAKMDEFTIRKNILASFSA
ncbi:hypothetical protein BZG36_01960 [Bifiguratus adelaidae]|uniref:protein disulfide-isomerase n=1 Tax=Bifiguratus adelaidae TaxID=1938954 RepID=A0A261Y3W8_9FUNG|nr:hypothetical protein BZG36_01960 [Bifiguratus adelaidae]